MECGLELDFRDDPDTFEAIASLFLPRTDCDSFHLPTGLSNAEDTVVAEFIRGFAVACALLTDATSMPASSITGMPGQMTVWLRPKKSNPPLFDQLYAVITQRPQFHLHSTSKVLQRASPQVVLPEFS